MAKITQSWISETINGIEISHPYPCHSSNYTNYSSRNVNYVIIHYTGATAKDTPMANCKYFKTANRKASAHLFVNETSIQQSVELRDAAWSIGCSSGYKTSARNSNTINIEMCCSSRYTVSTQTQLNTAYLCARMCQLLGITANTVDTYVLRHYDCVKSNKQCPKQYVTNPAQWTQFKTWVKNILNTGSHLGATSYVKNGIDYSHVFNPTFYANKYADLKAAFGNDATKLFNHFINNGIGELRQGSANFDVKIYASNYKDLRNAFGVLDVPKNKPSKNAVLYYNHYCTNGYREGREGAKKI